MHKDALRMATGESTEFERPAMSGVRLRGLLLTASTLGFFVLGASLTPQSSGHGTHRQLGLPACGFLTRTGYPCPTCGATTSVAAATHGQMLDAWRAHPFGVFLTLAVGALFLAAAVELVTGHSVLHVLPRRPLRLVAAGVLVLLLSWGYVVLVGTLNGRWPLH